MISFTSFNSSLPLLLPPRSRQCRRCIRFSPALLTSSRKNIYRSNSAGKPNAVRILALNSALHGGIEYKVLTAVKSRYNDIIIIDTAKSRMLLLDPTQLAITAVLSMFNLLVLPTNYLPDEFASLPAIVPKGPIAILGLGAGTAAHLMLDLWPSLHLEGWEIDEIVIDKAREYFGLSELEKHTQDGGVLHIHIGDALSPSVAVPGGYAGIVVDLFSDGEVLPQLQEVKTWLELNDKLMPKGRLMVNCGGTNDGVPSITDIVTSGLSSFQSTCEQVSTLKALSKAFPGQVGTFIHFLSGELSWKKMPNNEGENFLALTGPFPDLTMWSAALPDRLSSSVMQWRT
ncbi:hypothetical protein LguiA_015901 [Lonicera macranthoides]